MKTRSKRAAFRWLDRILILVAVFGALFTVVYLGLFFWSYSIFGPHDLLIDAAMVGDLGRVKYLSNFDLAISRTGFEDHLTPLGAASGGALAGGGYIDIVKFLLSKGVDVNARDDYKKTALQYARDQKHQEIEKLLLAAGGHL
jgi:hypothetical protein